MNSQLKPDQRGPEPTFATRLYELRTRKGLSAGEVAERSGVPLGEYQRWEDGAKDQPAIVAIRAVADVLDADPDELIRLAKWRLPSNRGAPTE